MNEKAKEIDITRDFLKNFPDPLWDKLDLEDCKPLSAIEGEQDGYRFIIMELEHLDFGLVADNRKRAVTTFFVVAIPEGAADRDVSWRSMDAQVSSDSKYVYLAKPRKQARPKEWRDLIQVTIKTVESLRGRAEMVDKAQVDEPTFRPVGAGVAINAFWAVVFFAFAVLFIGVGLAIMFGLIDYRPECFSFTNAVTPRCKVTTTVYSVGTALKVGGEYLLAGGLCLFGAVYYRQRVRKRMRNKFDAS
jgi:hypothetical protein